jgi:uncharacterized protein with PIN domain
MQEGGKNKIKNFIPSGELTPEIKARGFVVDSNLAKVGKMIQQRGVDVKILASSDAVQTCYVAFKENRVFLTTFLNVFNKKGGVPRGCLHYKATPFGN